MDAEDDHDLDNGEQKLEADSSSLSAVSYSVQIPGWPSCHHNVSCSHDSELAIALNDHVELLIPRTSLNDLTTFFRSSSTSASERLSLDAAQRTVRNVKAAVEGVPATTPFGSRSGSGSTGVVDLAGRTEMGRWSRCTFKTNLFTQAEMPLLQPIRFEDFSIGEEQTQSHILSLAWSAPGLSYNNGCALGILTANGAMSIWDAQEGKRDLAGEWKRNITANQAIRRWTKTLSSDKGVPRDDWSEHEWIGRQRLRSRLRDFAWMPVDDFASGKQMLVVSNDLLELVFVEVQRSRHTGDFLKAKVCGCLEISRSVSPQLLKTRLDSVRGPSRFAKDLACSPFIPLGGEGAVSCYIAYTVAEKLFLSHCSLKVNNNPRAFELSDEVWHIDGENLGHPGPLRWKEARVDQLSLLSCGKDHIITVDITASEKSWTQRISPHGLGWYSVAAWTITGDQDSDLLHYLPHMSYAETPCMSLDLNTAVQHPHSEWAKQVQKRKGGFSAEFSLGQDVAGRLWGMDALPIGSSITLCMTLHPAKLLQYQMSAFEHSHILISDETDTLPTQKRMKKAVTSTESILVAFARWLRRRVTRGSFTAQDHDLVAAFIASHTNNEYDDQTFSSKSRTIQQRLASVNGCYDWLKYHLFEIMRGTDTENLATVLPEQEDPEHKTRSNLIAIALNIGQYQARQSQLGKVVMSLYEAAYRFLQRSDTYDAMDLDLDVSSTVATKESCEICEAQIQFESTDWARCSKGHCFGRCNMTFLAIQEPGISRYCHICEKRYLSPRHLLSKDRKRHEDEDGDPGRRRMESADAGNALSLVESLVNAFETCIHCNGKLIG